MIEQGIPGLRGTEHIGFTVPDINQASDFFRDVIGCEVLHSLGPTEDANGTRMRDKLNVDPRARIKEFRLIRCKNGTNFEIFEWEAPQQNCILPLNSDVGGHHIAFYVDDIHAAANHLLSKGVRLLGTPEFVDDGAHAGEWWVYFLSPWGMQMEILSYPGGRKYESASATKLWNPRDH